MCLEGVEPQVGWRGLKGFIRWDSFGTCSLGRLLRSLFVAQEAGPGITGQRRLVIAMEGCVAFIPQPSFALQYKDACRRIVLPVSRV
jgi:hypothetical protein